MNVLIAPDKFKGSLTAAQVVHHLGSGLEQRGVHYDGLPLADGGDGSVAAAVAAGFRSVEIDVAAATGERHSAAIAFDGVTASMFLLHVRDSLEQRDWEAEVG